MTFTECWFDADARANLTDIAERVKDVPGIVIEIGAWEGRSTITLAEAISPRPLHTVDTWRGANTDESGKLAAARDVFARWVANVAHLNNVTAHRMDWREYVPTITEPVAFCFIDAEHTYEEVFDNIAAIVPLMSPGGVLCGDDINCADVRQAVTDALGGAEHHGALWAWVKA